VTTLGVEAAPKRLELLHEVISSAKTFVMLLNPRGPGSRNALNEMQAAARALAVQLEPTYASAESDFDAVFAMLAQFRAGGLVISNDGFINGQAERLGKLSLQHAVPAIHIYKEFAAAGGLMAYGGSLTEAWRLAGVYIGRIVKGEKAGDLPVQQATKVELIINLKTAKALGLTIPISLLGRGDLVIE
jgi:putative tryptophan/tyrosine transport system substrate-binding protein